MNTLNKFTILVVALAGLSACSVSNSRYSQKQDSAPEFHYGELELADATPRYEPYAPANFRPYTVLGQYYTPMLTAKGYEEHGEASWYGQKFHGHLTSNGEVYDMFSMTAAHKTLPLPSFVKVTNLDNQKIAIVRVNDRGPFHPGRVIDLSYAAAKKLDVLSTGVANVKVEIVHIDEDGIMTVGAGAPQQPEIPPSLAQPESNMVIIAQANTKTTMEDRVELESAAPPISNALASVLADNDKKSQIFVQVAAFSNAEKVSELSEGLARLYQVPTDAPLIDNIYRLRLGPLINEQKAEKLIQDLKSIGFDSAFQILSAD
jgi:rare lipoprotein A